MGIILASASKHRAQLLTNAGVSVECSPHQIDERAVEAALGDAELTPADLAEVLAEAKALDVSVRHPDDLIIGADQVLSLGTDIIHKSDDMDEARRKLLKLAGQTHQLSSAIVLARGGEVLRRMSDQAHMTMRELSPEFVGRYLARCGKDALGSVGVYQIEGAGMQLFDHIEGDYFTIIGLPLLPLLGALRELGEIDG